MSLYKNPSTPPVTESWNESSRKFVDKLKEVSKIEVDSCHLCKYSKESMVAEWFRCPYRKGKMVHYKTALECGRKKLAKEFGGK